MQRDQQQNNKNTDASAGTDQEQHQHRYQHNLDASVLTEQQRRQSMLASSLPSWLVHSRGGGGGGRRRRKTSSRPATTPSQHHHHVVVTWKPEHFPFKMYDLLEEVTRQGLESIIAWSTGGTTFTIHNQAAFEQWIMPLYFSGMSSYKSFRRQLNLYGIYQHRHRPTQDANAYSHEYFIRGRRELCDLIERRKKKNQKSSPSGEAPTTRTPTDSRSSPKIPTHTTGVVSKVATGSTGQKKQQPSVPKDFVRTDATATTHLLSTIKSQDLINARNGLENRIAAATAGGEVNISNSSKNGNRNYSYTAGTGTATTEKQMRAFELEFLLGQQQQQQQQQQRMIESSSFQFLQHLDINNYGRSNDVDSAANINSSVKNTTSDRHYLDRLRQKISMLQQSIYCNEASIQPNPVLYHRNSNSNNKDDAESAAVAVAVATTAIDAIISSSSNNIIRNNNNNKKRKSNYHSNNDIHNTDKNDNTAYIYRFFVKEQNWNDLPKGLSPTDVINEIITTFGTTTTTKGSVGYRNKQIEANYTP